ncbi:hypothetical protein F511_45120 [Dorcoceras hygrometricum]|uniref:Uncharacterized protein n=1 Tax=Dorcoceras hygrometricum TaxID=472368 RepID=A0A2Z6ZX06_9LAMI|nr:hypothetical protein F511_45120 [Dorcoceras hygrometricum]
MSAPNREHVRARDRALAARWPAISDRCMLLPRALVAQHDGRSRPASSCKTLRRGAQPVRYDRRTLAVGIVRLPRNMLAAAAVRRVSRHRCDG